jgi:hypothetical protein
MIIEDGMLIMKNGQLLFLNHGELITLREDVILEDGTHITLDGSLAMPDGSYQVISEGQAVAVNQMTTS